MKYLARIIPFLLWLPLLIGCRSVKYIPAETVRLDTLYTSKTYRDSIKEKDSILIILKGDTLVKNHYKTVDRWSVRTDTFWRVRIDTVQRYYPVEARLTKWQKFKINAGEILIGLVIAFSVAGLFYLLKVRKSG